ncbi:MAG TPA: DoxX family protein [Sphingomicrobium sp.]|nr:DoxX family protein [Sphingomicrobium sp.]
MRKRIDIDALPYALGAILLGMVTLAVHDFALQWQPVPQWVPARSALSIVSAAILVVGGLVAIRRSAGWARLTLPAFYALWVLALHVPAFATAPNVGTLLGAAEILSLAAAGVALAPASAPRWLRPSARILYGLCPLVFGLSHIVYADFTSSMVPAWLPARLFLAYFTGAAHIAAGLAILSGVFARLAARMLALMCASFVLLIHIPGVIGAPADRMQWTMLAVALSIAGGAWLSQRLLPTRQTDRLPGAATPAYA